MTYDNLLRINDDPDVREVLKFLREREVVHYQRFGEALRIVTDRLNAKNFYAVNPGFDKCQMVESVPGQPRAGRASADAVKCGSRLS